jgi:flagellar export protein FliJ
MKKFKFTLQAVHNLRESRRDNARQELVQLQTTASEAAERLEQTTQERLETIDNFSSKMQSGPIDPMEAALTTNYIAALVQREREAQYQLSLSIAAVEKQRLKVIEAAREVEATSVLRERQLARHELEASRAEQNFLDEITSVTIARKILQNR